MKKKYKRLLIVLAVILIINTVFVFAVGRIIYGVALEREQSGTVIKSGKENWLERKSEDLHIVSHDGINLHGYYLENPKAENRYALVCHGYSAEGADMNYYARKFYGMGYSVLAPDARCHGTSGGELIGMGYIEKADVLLWINEITRKDPKAQIVLFGVSMGAATVLFTSGEALPENVKAVISDCAYTDVYNEIGSAIRYTLPWVPSFPIVDCASIICMLDAGYSFRQASCVEAVKRSITPTLFIHGSVDTYVPFSMLDTLYESAGCKKQKLVIEGAEHAASAFTAPELYWGEIEAFLSEYVAYNLSD